MHVYLGGRLGVTIQWANIEVLKVTGDAGRCGHCTP
jgi:hypothetical protein